MGYTGGEIGSKRIAPLTVSAGCTLEMISGRVVTPPVLVVAVTGGRSKELGICVRLLLHCLDIRISASSFSRPPCLSPVLEPELQCVSRGQIPPPLELPLPPPLVARDVDPDYYRGGGGDEVAAFLDQFI